MKTIENFKPFHFQHKSILKGLEIMETKNSLLLMSETGLGKTIVAATIAYNLNPKRVLVISKKVHKKGWDEILSKTDLNFTVSGNRKIPTYTEPYDFIIIDEVHHVGTATSKTFLDLFMLSRQNNSKLIAISATPYNNTMESFLDLMTLFNLPEKEKTLIGFLGTQINEINYNLGVIRRIYGDEITGMHHTKITEKAFLNNELGKHIAFIGNVVGTFSIRDERSTIEILPTEHLLEKFPKTERVDLKYNHKNKEAFVETFRQIDKITFAWQEQINYFIPNSDSRFGTVYKTTLFKLFESSLNAFLASISKSIANIENCLNKNIIKIGDDEHTLTDKFKSDLENDCSRYKNIISIWEGKEDSDKMEILFDLIERETGKIVVFTEYSETLSMLVNEAEKRQISFISYNSDTNENVLETISAEFDANQHKSNKYKVLFCSDVLAEGVSLHYANHLVHYDSKWNPSKTIQREGRINRICMSNVRNDIKIYTYDVPAYIDQFISLNEKIDRKNSEANILISAIKEPGLDKFVSKFTCINLGKCTDENSSVVEFNKDYSIIINLGGNECLKIYRSHNLENLPPRYKIEVGSGQIVPKKRYQTSDHHVMIEQDIFHTFEDYYSVSRNEGKKDVRMMDNMEYDDNFYLRMSFQQKSVRSENKQYEFQNYLKAFKMFKHDIPGYFSNKVFSYPYLMIWANMLKESKGKEAVSDALNFMVEFLRKNEKHTLYMLGNFG